MRKGMAEHWVKVGSVLHFLNFLNDNLVVFAFPDTIALSLSEGSSWKKGQRKRDVPPNSSSSGNTQTASASAKGFNPLPPPVVLLPGQHNMGRVSCNFQYTGVYITRVRANSLKHTKHNFFFK